MEANDLSKKLCQVERERNELQQNVADLEQELESLSYAISHDLRAPLRAVHGFTNALREDYQDKLDAEGQRYLSIVVTSTQQMSRMIEAILTLSRWGRQPIQVSELSMQTIVSDLVNDLRLRHPNRPIEFTIAKLPDAPGDLRLVREIWTQLLSNAVRFTGGREAALVHVEGAVEGSELHYWVRDNGVGFDMKYEPKLFSLFQRFHGEKEFDGIGAGLAIVRRLVRRHGGRVWANAEVDQGATFHFALPLSLNVSAAG